MKFTFGFATLTVKYMGFRDGRMFGDLRWSRFGGSVKVETRLEWVAACVGGEEIGSEHRELSPRVWLWCKAEEKMRVMGIFLFFPFFFLRYKRLV